MTRFTAIRDGLPFVAGAGVTRIFTGNKILAQIADPME